MRMYCYLEIEATDNSRPYEHMFVMEGKEKHRAIDYARNTCVRRWACVPWFKAMHVWIGMNEDERYHEAMIVMKEPSVEVAYD